MKKTKIAFFWLLLLYSLKPTNAYADFWGGDLPLLAEIVANTLQQVSQLTKIIGTGQDTLNFLQDINRGLKDAMRISQTMNTTLRPGVLSDLGRVEDIITEMQTLYGRVPKTQSAPAQASTDQSVAEAIHMNNEVFRYADKIDPEAERIKTYAKDVNPLGAARLSAQALGVLINVMNQILRTNGAILKMQGEQVALMNRREKLNSEHFKIQYDGVSKAFGELRPDYRLSPLSSY